MYPKSVIENDLVRPGHYWLCPSCGGRSKAREPYCAGCGAALSGSPERPLARPRTPRPRGETLMRVMMAAGVLTAIGAGLLIRSLFGTAAFVPVEAREGERRQVEPLPPTPAPVQSLEMPLTPLAPPTPPAAIYAYGPSTEPADPDAGLEAWPPDPMSRPRDLPPTPEPRAAREEWRERQDQVREAREEYRDAQDELSDARDEEEEQEALERLEEAAARLRRAEAALDRSGADVAPAGRRRGRRR